jgi:glucose-6-phosphate-specific signal transduction histidine kinase
LDLLTLDQALRHIVRAHERRTHSTVHCAVTDLPADLPGFVKDSVCRFVKDGLDHAYERASGTDQRVSVWWDGASLMIEVKNEALWGASSEGLKDALRLGMTGPWDGHDCNDDTTRADRVAGQHGADQGAADTCGDVR